MSSCGHSPAAASVVYNERKWLGKKTGERWEHKEDARGFMCNSSLAKLAFMLRVLRFKFPKECLVVAAVGMHGCWKTAALR